MTDLVAEISTELAGEWLPNIYAGHIRSQRTRSYKLDVAERENRPEILYTLLGIELKVGKKRFACPDLATARYLRVFARLGCRAFAVPYDITKISPAADVLETAWQRTLLILEARMRDRPQAARTRARAKIIAAVRAGIYETGAGDTMPAFDRETRQREV